MVNAATEFTVPHPPFNNFTLVAMIVSTRMCRVQYSTFPGLASELLFVEKCSQQFNRVR